MNHQVSTVFGRERRWHDYCCNNNTPWIFLRKSVSGKGGNCIDSMPADPDSNPASAAKWNAHSYPDCQDFSLLDISHQKNKNKTKLERTRTRRRNVDDGLEYICFTGSREDGEQRAGSKRQDHRHGDAPVLYTGGALIAAAHDTTTIAAASSLRNPAPQA
jgi:hypothetical protein